MRSDQLEEAYALIQHVADDSSLVVSAEKRCTSAEIAIRRGRYQEAQVRLETCKDALQPLQGHLRLMGYYHYISGFRHQMNGAFHESISDYEKGLSLLIQDDPAMNEALLSTLNNLGNVYYRMGDNEKATSIHLEVLAGRRQLWGSTHPKIAATLGNLGNVYEAAGNPETALHYHRAAENIWRAQADSFRLQLGFTLNNIGIAHLALGEFERARTSMQEALQIKEAILGSESASFASSLTYLGKIENNTDAPEAGRKHISQALQIYEHLGLKDHPRYSIALGEMAMSLHDLGLLTEALSAVDEELVRIEGRSSPVAADLHLIKSRIHFSMLDYSSALKASMTSIDRNTGTVGAGSSEAILLLKDASNSSLLLDALEIKARSLMTLAEQQRSFSTWHRAFDTLENLITLSNAGRLGLLTSGSPERRGSRFDSQLVDFIDIGLTLAEQTRDELLSRRLLIATDMYLGGHLISELLSIRPRFPAWLEGQEVPADKEIPANQETFEMHTWPPDVPWPALGKQAVLHGLHAGTGPQSPLSETFRLLNGLVLPNVPSNQSILEYVQVRDQVIAFVINSEGVSTHRLGNGTAIRMAKDAMYEALKAHDTDTFVALATELHRRLLEPVETFIDQDDLLIIPHDVASGIPFELLIAPDHSREAPAAAAEGLPYLIRERSVSYGYSVAHVVHNSKPTKQAYEKEFLGVAPVFDQPGDPPSNVASVPGLVDLTAMPVSLHTDALPDSEKEVLEISDILRRRASDMHPGKRNHITVYLRDAITESDFKQLPLSEYRYIHFATHGYARRDQPQQSGILLETNPEPGEDGVLRAYEVADLTIGSELVVLSACDSAVEGRWPADISGLAKSFLYAGSRHVVASVWPSDDAGTRILMRIFYAYLSEGHTVDDALRSAKLDLLDAGGAISNPYYWAGFIHIGAPGSLDRSSM